MTRDPKRARLANLLRENGLSMARASAAIGRNNAYLQQYLRRGMPKVLAFQDTQTLGRLLGCDPSELQHGTRPPPAPLTHTRRHRGQQPFLVAIPEIPVSACADFDGIADPSLSHRASWQLPGTFVRYESDADPAGLRILKVEGDAMVPELRSSDRILVDTSRRLPALGELFVLWDGNAIVVKRTERIHGSAPSTIRLHSDGRFHSPYTCLASETRLFGKVLWTVRKL